MSGLAGTAVMTVFQKLIEMPLTGRSDSYAPASFAEKVSPDAITARTDRRRLNYGTHFALGTMWGAVFGTVYTGDVVLNTALGLYKPGSWSGKDWVVDVIDKLVQAVATDVVLDRIADPAR